MKFASDIKLVLEDGSEFLGKSFGYPTSVSGEVVFNTAMTGYTESFSDPSYNGQILVMTYPLVGNYGIPGEEVADKMLKFFESERAYITALVVTDYCEEHSHWNALQSLGEWLSKYKIPAITGVDTRAVTKLLREKGTMLGKVVYQNQDIAIQDPFERNLVDEVSCKELITYGSGQHKILLVDCGVKYNIIRYLLKEGDVSVVRVPWNYDFSKEQYDGLFISNGPGNPERCVETIQHLKKALEEDRPIMGICLGNQLMGLATGAKTFKLPYGHRSHNQPVLQNGSKCAFVTAQNHSFAIDSSTLSPEWECFYTNLNDNTNEGIRHKTKPFFSAQFHPEASSGPDDTGYLFRLFMDAVTARKAKKS